VNEIDEGELASALRSGGVVDGAADGIRRVVPAGLLHKCLREIGARIWHTTSLGITEYCYWPVNCSHVDSQR
jgi:hypothetical protein